MQTEPIQIPVEVLESNAAALAGIQAKLGALGTSASTATPQVNALGGGLGNLGKTLLGSLGPIAGFATLSGAVLGFIKIGKESINLAAEAETANVKLAQSLLSSGRGAEISSAQIDKFATALMPIVGIDDEKIKDAYAAIAGFQNLPTDKMNDIVTIAADMSAAFGGDLVSNATMIAGVLETGVIPRMWRFDAALKVQIQDMIKAGDTAGALALTLGELNRKYGGQAAAQMDTYTGKVGFLKIAWQELLEAEGASMIKSAEHSGVLDAAAAALMTAADRTNLLTRAQEMGIEVAKGVAQGQLWLNGHLITYDELLSIVTKTEWDNADATNEGARALGRMTTATNMAVTSTDMFTGAILDSATALQQEQAEFGFIINFAKQYENNLANITTAEGNLRTAEDDLATARAQWPEGNQHVIDAQIAVDGLKVKLGEAQQASLDATNEMIAGFLQAQLTMDGSFTEDDIQKVLAYRRSVGLLSKEAYEAALNALHIAENLASIPDKTVHVTTIYSSSGQSVNVPEVHGGHASGGSFSGWAMVGDRPGGGMTPYTEWVYAPHGAMVYNQSQMSGQSAPPMAGGGAIPIPSPARRDAVDLSHSSMRELARVLRDMILQVAR